MVKSLRSGWWRAAVLVCFVPSGRAFSQYPPGAYPPPGPVMAPPPPPQPLLPPPPSAPERRKTLGLRAWVSLGVGCDQAPIFSTKGETVGKRGYVGANYGAFLPIRVPGGELSVGWEGHHGFGSDMIGLCFGNPEDKSHHATAFFALHPGIHYRFDLAGAQEGFSLKLGAGAAFMVRQLFYTRSALVSRGPEVGTQLDFELKNRWSVRPVANGFFWFMQPLTGVGAASSREVIFPGGGEVSVAREFSSTGSFMNMRFGGSVGATVMASGGQTLSILAGYTRSQTDYAGVFTDTSFTGSTDPLASSSRKPVSVKSVDATESEDFVYLTIRGEPSW